jgi:uncharacterized membrane protein
MDALVMVTLDLIWITLVMGPKYQTMVHSIQGSPLELNYMWAAMAYLSMMVGYHYLVKDAWTAVILGLVIFSVYDFTAAAVFKDWNIPLAILDILWGGTLFLLTYGAKMPN